MTPCGVMTLEDVEQLFGPGPGDSAVRCYFKAPDAMPLRMFFWKRT